MVLNKNNITYKKLIAVSFIGLSLAACSSSKEENISTTNIELDSPNLSPVSFLFWPTKGPVISTFSDAQEGNKGIDISGERGQAIVAAAGGKVVYSDNALRGYGNLVIIRHNDELLSAYAHNDTLLVMEGQMVNAGQRIATMGNSDASSTRLHFEIRYKGRSVDPIPYLPAKFISPIKKTSPTVNSLLGDKQ